MHWHEKIYIYDLYFIQILNQINFYNICIQNLKLVFILITNYCKFYKFKFKEV